MFSYKELLKSKGFELNKYKPEGNIWDIELNEKEVIDAFCNAFDFDGKSNPSREGVISVVMQCKEDYSECRVDYLKYAWHTFKMETEEFMRCIKKF